MLSLFAVAFRAIDRGARLDGDSQLQLKQQRRQLVSDGSSLSNCKDRISLPNNDRLSSSGSMTVPDRVSRTVVPGSSTSDSSIETLVNSSSAGVKAPALSTAAPTAAAATHGDWLRWQHRTRVVPGGLSSATRSVDRENG